MLELEVPEPGVDARLARVVEAGVALLPGYDLIVRQVENKLFIAPDARTGRAALQAPAGVPQGLEFAAVDLREVADEVENAAAVTVVPHLGEVVGLMTADAFQMSFELFQINSNSFR